MTAVLSSVAAQHDLSVTQLRLLVALRDRSSRVSELADHLGLDRSSVRWLVVNAVGRGLVERIIDESDGNRVRVALTDAGRDVADRGAAEVARRTSPLLARLVAADQHKLAGLLARLLDD